MTLGITTLCHYAECRCAECHVLFIVMLNVIMLTVVMLSVIMLNVVVTPAAYAIKYFIVVIYCHFTVKMSFRAIKTISKVIIVEWQ
jgi:hypothetical protein